MNTVKDLICVLIQGGDETANLPVRVGEIAADGFNAYWYATKRIEKHEEQWDCPRCNSNRSDRDRTPGLSLGANCKTCRGYGVITIETAPTETYIEIELKEPPK